jgi:hypothetical protein
MKDNKIIGIALTTEILKQLEDGKFNKSKLIDSLLTEYFNKEKLKKDK